MSEPEPRFSWQEALDLLESAPARIEAATSGVPADDLLEPLEPGGWSARDVLGHMRACDHTWGGYIDRILDEDHPSFRAESPRSTIRRTDVLSVPFGASLAAFTHDRARLIARLRAADATTLARTATVLAAWPGPRGTDGRDYAHRIVEHEGEHVRNIERVMGAGRWPEEATSEGRQAGKSDSRDGRGAVNGERKPRVALFAAPETSPAILFGLYDVLGRSARSTRT